MAKINIKESLLNLDKETYCKYDLTTMYENCNITEKDKEKLAKMLSENVSTEKVHNYLLERFIQDKNKFVDDLQECDKLFVKEDLSDTNEDNYLNTESIYKEIQSKQIPDMDGFMTDYTWYLRKPDQMNVFVYGDKDYYKPEDGYFDYETENSQEAREWFDSYNGFEDDDEDGSLTESKESTNNELKQDLIKLAFTPEDAELLIKINPNYAENIAYGNTTTEDIKEAQEYIKSKEIYYNKYGSLTESKSIKESFPRNIDLDQVVIQTEVDELETADQKISSANTSINSNKLPAIFRLVKFEPDTLNLDYGGGKFDNAAEYLAQQNVTNLVYDPYNRSTQHNAEVLQKVRENGGADTITISNVLNVIAEPEARLTVLRNAKKLVKPGGNVYITVYEGNKSGEGTETKSGYQLNKGTADYIDEIASVFSTVNRKGKLIIAK